MQNDSDRVNDLFIAGAQDWSPAAALGAASVIYAPFFSDTEVSKTCKNILSETELERTNRFVTEKDAVHFIQRRAFRRFCGALALGTAQPLSQIEFTETAKGRPSLPEQPELWFSFSSCRFGFLGAWSSTHAIGIDFEDKNGQMEPTELAQQFFAETEARAVEAADSQARRHIFFQFWCLKEAALKSIGEGLPFGLDAFEFELTPHLRVVRAPNDHGGPRGFRPYLRLDDEICTAIVIRDRD